jgi:hypothetical protein
MICKKEFTIISELYIHLKNHLTCDICKTEFSSKKIHQKHCKLHESKVKQFPYKCHVCDLLFETKDAISKHNHITLDKYNDSTGENRIQYCKSCNMTFRNRSIYRYFNLVQYLSQLLIYFIKMYINSLLLIILNLS